MNWVADAFASTEDMNVAMLPTISVAMVVALSAALWVTNITRRIVLVDEHYLTFGECSNYRTVSFCGTHPISN
jgi:hypothetical protein